MMIAVIQPPCILYTLFRHFDKELEKTDISNTNLKRENEKAPDRTSRGFLSIRWPGLDRRGNCPLPGGFPAARWKR